MTGYRDGADAKHRLGSDGGVVTDRIVVIGDRAHGKVVINALKEVGASVAGYVDATDKGHVLGLPWLGTGDDLPAVREQDPNIAVAIGVGKVDTRPTRLQPLARIESMGIHRVSVSSTQAVLNEQVTIGSGTVVVDVIVVGSGSVLGHAYIVDSKSTVEHDCDLGDDVHMGPGAVLSGAVRVGDGAFIGAGATVVRDLHLAGGCLIGVSLTVTRDISKPGTCVGSPARLLSTREIAKP